MNEQQPLKHSDNCLDRGFFVSLRDGELTPEERSQALDHLATCVDCAAEERGVSIGSREVYNLLSTLGPTTSEIPELAAALAAFRAELNAQDRQEDRYTTLPFVAKRTTQLREMSSGQKRPRWVIASIAAALVALLVLPNAGVWAAQFLALFRVQQFQPITVDPQNFRFDLLANLKDFGDMQEQFDNPANSQRLTQAQVERSLHFSLLLPSHLPPGTGHTIQFTLINGGHATFVFNAAKARAYLAQVGQSTVNIPGQLDGATFNITLAPGVVVNYLSNCQSQEQAQSSTTLVAPTIGKNQGQCSTGKPFYVGEIPSPVVRASGKATLKDLRDFAASLPNLPSEIRYLLQQVDLDSGTVPLPIPPEINAEKVTAHEAPGVLLLDNSMNLGAVLWQTHGIIYMIASATSNRAELLDTANSLQ